MIMPKKEIEESIFSDALPYLELNLSILFV